MTCSKCGQPANGRLCQICRRSKRMEGGRSRQKRASIVGRDIRLAINRSRDGDVSEARTRIQQARDLWWGSAEIATHLQRADTLDATGLECRYHLREALQLLGTVDGIEAEFQRGGMFA